MSSSCLICCCGSEVPLKTCSSVDCDSKICTECLERFLEIGARERTTPRCLATGCSALFLRSVLPMPVYDLALFRGLLRDPQLNEDTRFHDQQHRLREQLINEREKFLETSFPESIRRAVHIMYGSELRKVHKSNLETMRRLGERETKRCFRVFCKGFMRLEQEKWTCALCDSVFCSRCESGHEEPHQCRPEDRASVEWKNSLPQCPKCHQTIEKSDGCDNMTCAVCQTNFSYSTGERTVAGNHGASIPVRLSTEGGVDRLWDLLLRGRAREALSTKEERVARELETLDDLPSHSGEWRASDIPALVNWSEDSSEEDELRVAKSVAVRVERLEKKRQQCRHAWNRLRRLEDEILSLK